MRTAIAAALRRLADRLAPQPQIVEIERQFVALKRRRGGRGLGFE